MWKAYLNRRELLESLLTGAMTKFEHCDDIEGDANSSLDDDQLLAFWISNPSSGNELPVMLVTPDVKLVETLALFASTPQLPSPFSSFCRVISESEFIALSSREAAGRSDALDGLVGMALAEVTILSNGNLRVADIGPAACKRSLSFTFGRSLFCCTTHFLPLSVQGWYKVQQLVNPFGNIELMRSVGEASTAIFGVAAEVFFGLPPTTNLSSICYEIIEFGEPSEDLWASLKSPVRQPPSLKMLSGYAREERGSYLQAALVSMDNAKARPTDEEVAFCALLATRIAPGSFEHMNLLAGFSDKRVALWYGFFAALQRRSQALRGYGGIGLRVRRDLLKVVKLSDVPSSDIALNELLVISKQGVDVLTRRLGHSNEIVVELCPMLEASFRFSLKQEKAVEYSGGQDRQGRIPLSNDVAGEPLSVVVDKLDVARELLADISVVLKGLGHGESKSMRDSKGRNRPRGGS